LSLVDLVEEVLSRDISVIDGLLSVKDGVREEVIRVVRELIRFCGEAIRLVHLGLYEEASSSLEYARGLVEKLNGLLSDHPDLYYSGLVYNGLSEYVEARITYSLIVEKKMPRYNELNVPYIPFLQGLGDVIGELRRHVLNLLNKGAIDEASTYLEVMERIYMWLKKLNYPDPLTPGLRHKVDVARRLVEDTKTLLINTRNTYLLLDKLREK